MKVTTIDGGFRGARGLARLTTEQSLALEERFTRAVDPLYQLYERAVQASDAGQITSSVFASIRRQYDSLADRVESHAQRLSSIETEADLATWQSQANALQAEVGRFVRTTATHLGIEIASRGWRLALIAGVSVAVLGGAAWLLVRSSRRRRLQR